MPFAAPSMNEEDELKSQEKNGGVNISGSSTSFSTGIPGQEQSGQKKQAGSGAKFANIQSYLDANQSQGQEMGQKITSDVTANADDATQKVNSFQSKAPTVAAYDPSAAYKNVTSLTDQDKQAYNQAKGGYKGPQQLDQVQGYGDTQKAVGNAYQQVQNSGNEAGQRQLLKDTYKRPSYSGGENALDQTIVQSNPNARKGFEDITQKYSGLNTMFDTSAQDVGGKVNQAIGTGLANQNAIATGEVNAKKSLLDPIKQRAIDQTASNKQLASTIGADLSDETLSEQTLAALGLNDGQGLYDLNLKNYFRPDETQVGINNVATGDERSRYSALTSLIDGAPGKDITADGKAINPINFNREQFDKDFTGKDTEYKDAYLNQRGSVGAGTGLNYWDNATPKEVEEGILQLESQGNIKNGTNTISGNAADVQASKLRQNLDRWKNETYKSGRTIKKG